MDQAFDALDDFYACCRQWLFTASRDGTVLRLSAPLSRLLGPEVKRGSRLSERVHPDDRAAFEAAWAQIDEGAEPAPFTFRLEGQDGAYLGVSCAARRSPRSGEIHGELEERRPPRDFDEKKRDEDAVILRAIEENLPICVWMIEREGVFTHQAGKGLAAAGLQAGQFLGMNIFEIEDLHSSAAGIRQALAGELMHRFSLIYGVHWESWYIPCRDERGEVTSMVGVTIDLSEAKRAEMELRDKLALIERQQQVIRALSTPIIEIWDKVLTLPLIGVVDSGRVAEVMDSLLALVSLKGARFAVLDVTGVETVDTSSASHLLKLIQAIRLLGGEAIITGIRPSVAQTMVALGVGMESVVTLATLRDGLRYCIKQMRAGASLPGVS